MGAGICSLHFKFWNCNLTFIFILFIQTVAKYLLKHQRVYLYVRISSTLNEWCFSPPFTVFPHIRPAGIIILHSLQMRVLLENTTFPLHKIVRIAGIIKVASIIRGRALYEEIRYLKVQTTYRISSYSFRPWIVSAPLCTVTKGHST